MKSLKMLLIAVCMFVFAGAYAADTGKDHDMGMMGMQGMQEKMQKMEAQMNAMMGEKDPAKRHEMMEKNMSKMRDDMHMMKMGPTAKDQGMMGRMHMMEENMDKMQHEMDGMPHSDKAAAVPADKAGEHNH